MKRLFCLLLATLGWSWTMKVKGRCLPRLRWAMGTSEHSSACSSAPSQVCTHSHAPGKGWHHEAQVQSKQCSHLLEDIKSPRVVLCFLLKSTLLWFSYEKSLHRGLFVIVGVIPFQLQLFFRVSKLGKVCRTDSPQAYHNRSQLSVHEWGFQAGIPKWGCPLCKASLPRIFVSECGFTLFRVICQVFLGKDCAVVTCP